jgi:hypothetical protein
MMASPETASSVGESMPVGAAPRKPRILLATSGSVAAVKFANLCHCFSEWAEVRAVATRSSLHFIDRTTIPKDVILYTDEDEWSSWKKLGDCVLHIELRKWADIMVIAPLSANTLGKVINLINIRLILYILSTYMHDQINGWLIFHCTLKAHLLSIFLFSFSLQQINISEYRSNISFTIFFYNF